MARACTYILEHLDFCAHGAQLLVILALELTEHGIAVLAALVGCRCSEAGVLAVGGHGVCAGTAARGLVAVAAERARLG